MEDNSKNRKLLVFHTIEFLSLPILSFFTSVKNYKNGISQFFFVLFAFYFGWQLDTSFSFDLGNHYYSFTQCFVNRSLSQIISNPFVYGIGKEPYHIIFKFLVAQISSNSHFFAACAAAIYAIIFLYFFRQLSSFYQNRQLQIQLLILCAIAVTVEFYWYCGVRYWPGAFFFLAFFIKYIKTDKRKYLFISFCAVLFHSAHGILIIAVLLGLALKNHRKILYALVCLCVILGRLANSILYYLQMVPFLNLFVRDVYFDSDKIESTNAITAHFRNEGNLVYQNRTNAIFCVSLLILYMLWRRNKNVNQQYSKFYSILLSFFAVANLLYANITAYERVYKLFVVLFLTYLYFLLHSKINIWINKRKRIIVLLIGIILFSLLTAIVQQRKILMDPTIWFGSIWSL